MQIAAELAKRIRKMHGVLNKLAKKE